MNIIDIEFIIFDYVLLVITLIIVIFSFWKGFINSILGLLTWVGSVFITIYTYEYFSNYLNNLLLNINFLSNFEQFLSIISIVISIPIIFLLSLFILKRIRKILSSDLDKQIFGLILDKFFGLVYGFVFSYILYSTILYLTNNNDISILNSINIFMIENSNILKEVGNYNNNILEMYNNDSQL